jgi:hypothetical protein
MSKKSAVPAAAPVLFLAWGLLASCASVPPDAPDQGAPAPGVETGGIPTEPQASRERVPTDAAGEPEQEDEPDIWKRAEEMLAYLDKPVTPDLPEPEYVPPDSGEDAAEPEEETADLAEREPEPENASLTEEEAAAIPLPEPEASVAQETPPEPEAPVAQEAPPVPEAETAAETPPEPARPPAPPASLRPPETAAAAAPAKKPVPVPPAPLPALPARVPSNETQSRDAPGRTPEPLPVARSVQMDLDTPADISFPGTGWVYSGEIDGKKGLAYQRRGITGGNQVFTFRPEAPGSYRLKFLKQNPVRNTDTEEIIGVSVAAGGVDTAHLEPQDGAAGETGAPLQAAGALPPDNAAAESAMLSGAAGETPAPVVDDASLWNRGQALEAPGPNRDIKGALAAYKTLIRDYPQSEHYSGSQKRIAYLERFFVNIR